MKYLSATILSLSMFICLGVDGVFAQRSTSGTQVVQSRAVVGNSGNVASTFTVSASPENTYKRLQNRCVEIRGEISSIEGSIPRMKRSQAKKAQKSIAELQVELRRAEAQMQLYPRSITDPEYAQRKLQEEKSEFKKSLDEQSSALIASTDPYSGRMSSDPELQNAYDDHLASLRPAQDGDFYYDPSEVVYRIFFTVSKKPIPAKNLKSMEPYTAQKFPGGIAYYTGNYSSLFDANMACNQLKIKGVYRDAVVVAMVGDRRVPLR